jgi:hypothetical protein
MPPLVEQIKSLSVPQKAELFKLLQEDEELKNYLSFNDKMLEELAQRDKAYEEGKIQLTTRQQLSTRLKNRRNAL